MDNSRIAERLISKEDQVAIPPSQLRWVDALKVKEHNRKKPSEEK